MDGERGRGSGGCERPPCTQVGRPLPPPRRAWSARPLLGAEEGGKPHARRARRGDRCLAPAAHERGRDCRDALEGALDGLGNLAPGGSRSLGPARARAALPLRALTSGRAPPPRRQTARAHRGRRRQAGDRGQQAQPRPTPTGCRGPRAQDDRLGVRARGDRRPLPARLRRGLARSADEHRDRLPRPRPRPLPPLRDHRRAGADRQRLRLHLGAPCARLSQARHPPPAHPTLPPANERQGRALHPHAPSGMGIRSYLPLERGTHRRP
jgi:hypothetical protein